MSLDETLKFNVIEMEWSPEFERHYALGWNTRDEGFYSHSGNYETLSELAREIAARMVGTNCSYEIRSEPKPRGGEDYFKNNEGLSGNSESLRFIYLARKLDREEMSDLGRALMFAIRERKRFLELPDD